MNRRDVARDPEEEERQSAFGLWMYAFQYIKAARTVDDADPNPWVASSVTYQCVCQGIELAFKAYLRSRGWTTFQLKSLGHSLQRCMKKAITAGLPKLDDKDAESIKMVDRYYKAHEFRYIRTGMKEYPGFGELLRIGAVLLDSISEQVAAAMGNLELANRMTYDVSRTFGFTKPRRVLATPT